MKVSDGHVAVLRALLVGDPDEYERVVAPYVETGAEEGYVELVAAAFIEAVNRRFGQDRRIVDIIRYVAAVRAGYGNEADDLDPVVAERLVRVALGESTTIADGNEDVKARAQVLLLCELVADEQLDDPGLDEFRRDAQARAERTPA